MSLCVRPITLREANAYVISRHRHHGPTAGGKFAIMARDGSGGVRGVAICGRPVSRVLDDGETLEVTRVCTDGARNACSLLYGAAARIARDMGYRKIITYILQSEPGTSLRAAGFVLEAENTGKPHWTGERQRSRLSQPKLPAEKKKRYAKTFRE